MKKVKTLVLIFIILSIVLIYFYSRPKYSFEDIVEILDKNDEISDNMSVKIENIYVDGKIHTGEIYTKNNIIYEHQKRIENNEIKYETEEIWNYEDKSIITILHDEKLIYNEKIKGKGKANPITNIIMSFSQELKETPKRLYTYHGVREIDGQEFVKFSIKSEDDIYKSDFYINTKDGNLLKIEAYINDEHEVTTTVAYNYGTVTDEDILKFDSSNYTDYEYSDKIYHY